MSMAGMVRVGVQAAMLPVLARLLEPHDYGLVALAMPVIVLSMVLCDGGLPAPLLRRQEDDESVWAAAHGAICISGAGLALLLILLARPLAWICDEPALWPLVMALSITLLLQGLGAIPAARLQKAHRFGAISAAEVAGTIAGVVVLLAVAMQDGGAWALVAQQITYWIVRLGAGLIAFGSAQPIRIDMRLIAQDITFGWAIIKVNLVNFATRSTDVFLLGLFTDSVQVGLYAMALQLARLPANIIIGPLQGVLLSHLVKLREEPGAIGAMLVTVTSVVAAVILPATAVAVAIAPRAFETLISARWLQSAYIYSAMAPALAAQSLMFLVMPCLVALGRPDRQLRLTLGFTLVWLVCVAIGARHGGIGVALGMDMALLLSAPATIWIVRHDLQLPMQRYFAALLRGCVSALVAVGAVSILGRLIVLGDIAFLAMAGACAAGGTVIGLMLNRQTLGMKFSVASPA